MNNCSEKSLIKAATEINRSSRPVVYIKYNAENADICHDIISFAETISSPVCFDGSAKNSFAVWANHPLNITNTGISDPDSAIAKADLIIAVDSSADDINSSDLGGVFSKDAKIIFVNPPASEACGLPLCSCLTGDTKEIFNMLKNITVSRYYYENGWIFDLMPERKYKKNCPAAESEFEALSDTALLASAK